MKTVNLLPEWYQQQRRQRQYTRIHLVVMLCVGAVMVSGVLLGHERNNALTGCKLQLEKQLVQMRDPNAALQDRQVELHRLEELQVACRELGKPIPMSAVVQQIQNDMSKDMMLSHIMIDVRPEPVKGSGFVGDAQNPPKYHDVAHLNIVGNAPTDAQITQLFGKISGNHLFGDVTLNYMRTAIIKGYSARQFEIELQMDLERLTTEDPDAVASAGSDMRPGGGNDVR